MSDSGSGSGGKSGPQNGREFHAIPFDYVAYREAQAVRPPPPSFASACVAQGLAQTLKRKKGDGGGGGPEIKKRKCMDVALDDELSEDEDDVGKQDGAEKAAEGKLPTVPGEVAASSTSAGSAPGKSTEPSTAESSATSSAVAAAPIKFTVFVSGLAPETDEAALAKAFADCGEVIGCMVWRKACGGSKCKAFVDFANDEAVENALSKKDGTQLDGKCLHVERKKGGAGPTQPAKGDAKKDATEKDDEKEEKITIATPSTVVFMQNIYNNVPENVFESFCRQAGEVVEFRLMPKKRCAVVQYKDKDASRRATMELNGKKLMGQNVKVQYDKRGESGMRRVIGDETRHAQKEEALRKKKEQKPDSEHKQPQEQDKEDAGPKESLTEQPTDSKDEEKTVEDSK